MGLVAARPGVCVVGLAADIPTDHPQPLVSANLRLLLARLQVCGGLLSVTAWATGAEAGDN